MFDTSKIPDIWDNLYYDLITHRRHETRGRFKGF